MVDAGVVMVVATIELAAPVVSPCPEPTEVSVVLISTISVVNAVESAAKSVEVYILESTVSDVAVVNAIVVVVANGCCVVMPEVVVAKLAGQLLHKNTHGAPEHN